MSFNVQNDFQNEMAPCEETVINVTPGVCKQLTWRESGPHFKTYRHLEIDVKVLGGAVWRDVFNSPNIVDDQLDLRPTAHT